LRCDGGATLAACPTSVDLQSLQSLPSYGALVRQLPDPWELAREQSLRDVQQSSVSDWPMRHSDHSYAGYSIHRLASEVLDEIVSSPP
jgi:hypothetical protein